MAIGDDAQAAGYPLVPNTGNEDARVRYGAREINRTRDFIAQVKALIPATWPITKGGTGATTKAQARTNLGFTNGTSVPANSVGDDGDVFFRVP